MEFINTRSNEERGIGDDRVMVSTGNVKKYTYILPSGREIKVVVDHESELVETATTVPWFLVRIEDELES